MTPVSRYRPMGVKSRHNIRNNIIMTKGYLNYIYDVDL